jgi:hypothetical protein
MKWPFGAATGCVGCRTRLFEAVPRNYTYEGVISMLWADGAERGVICSSHESTQNITSTYQTFLSAVRTSLALLGLSDCQDMEAIGISLSLSAVVSHEGRDIFYCSVKTPQICDVI